MGSIQLLKSNMIKIAVVACFFGAALGGTPQCNTIWEQKCWDEPRQQCDTVQKPFTTTVYEQECNTIQVLVGWGSRDSRRTRREYRELPAEENDHLVRQKEYRSEQECRTVNDRQCKN